MNNQLKVINNKDTQLLIQRIIYLTDLIITNPVPQIIRIYFISIYLIIISATSDTTQILMAIQSSNKVYAGKLLYIVKKQYFSVVFHEPENV